MLAMAGVMLWLAPNWITYVLVGLGVPFALIYIIVPGWFIGLQQRQMNMTPPSAPPVTPPTDQPDIKP